MFATPGMQNCGLMIIAIVLDGAPAWWSGKVVKMTDMPQTVAIYSGMGGGAAATIAALEFARGEIHGAVPFSGSCVAFAKLQGLMNTAWHLPAQNAVNIVLVGIGIVLGDAPTATQIIAGIVLGAAGTRLTQRMAKAINRPISNTLFSPIADRRSPIADHRRGAGRLRPDRHDEGGLVDGRCLDDALRAEGDHRARLRHGGGWRPAQGSWHDQAAGGGGRALRADLRP